MNKLAMTDETLHREILKLAMRRRLDQANGERWESAQWRDKVRLLMFQQIEAELGALEDEACVEGYVAACEGHNHAIAKSMTHYASMNVKDFAARVGRKPALALPDDSSDLHAVEGDDEEAEVPPALQVQPQPQASRTAAAKRAPASGLASLVANARWSR